MTADPDLSPEAVERLLSLPRLYIDRDGDLCCERDGYNLVACPAVDDHPTNGLLNLDMWESIPQYQALAIALSAERDAAWQAGAEAMREAAIMAVNSTVAPIVGTPYSAGGRAFADAIRALPLPGQPKEDA